MRVGAPALGGFAVQFLTKTKAHARSLPQGPRWNVSHALWGLSFSAVPVIQASPSLLQQNPSASSELWPPSLCVACFVQKWSKGKQKEKVNNMVLFDQATYDKLLSEVPKYKLITPSVLCDRLRVSSHA